MVCSFPEEFSTWALAFHVYPLPDSDKWLELAGIFSHFKFSRFYFYVFSTVYFSFSKFILPEKISTELFPKAEHNDGEWLNDSTRVYRMHTFLTLLEPFKEVRNPPASSSTQVLF